MTRETKLGLVVSGSVLCLLGALIGKKLIDGKPLTDGAEDNKSVASAPASPSKQTKQALAKIEEPKKFPLQAVSHQTVKPTENGPSPQEPQTKQAKGKGSSNEVTSPVSPLPLPPGGLSSDPTKTLPLPMPKGGENSNSLPIPGVPAIPDPPGHGLPIPQPGALGQNPNDGTTEQALNKQIQIAGGPLTKPGGVELPAPSIPELPSAPPNTGLGTSNLKDKTINPPTGIPLPVGTPNDKEKTPGLPAPPSAGSPNDKGKPVEKVQTAQLKEDKLPGLPPQIPVPVVEPKSVDIPPPAPNGDKDKLELTSGNKENAKPATPTTEENGPPAVSPPAIPVAPPNNPEPKSVPITPPGQGVTNNDEKSVPLPVPVNPMPPVGANPGAKVGPMNIVAPPANPGQTSQVKVREFTVETYQVEPNMLDFRAISKKKYLSEKYAEALLLYNRKHPNASAAVLQDPPKLTAGDRVYIPPLDLLESQYSGAIKDYRPIVAQTPSIQVPVTVKPPSPTPNNVNNTVPKTVTPPINIGASQQTTAKPGEYVVQRPKEMLWEIARDRLGDPKRWSEIYRLNRQVNPALPLPQGTILKLPVNARQGP